ncbi:MAG: hypothetical protein IH945_12560 [Armatimonadetes bacterium]|nr:hypothetical protein [Armatimonadota bacterium]
MLTTVLVSLAISSAAPKFAETTITGATIFRNGYGFVVTETWLDESGTTYVRALPQAVEGTLWFAPGKYAQIKSITVTSLEAEPQSLSAETIPEILALNVGRTVGLTVYDARNDKTKELSGKILNVSRGFVLLQTREEMRTVAFSTIQSLKGAYDDFTTSADTKVSVPVLKVLSEPGTGGTLYTICLIEGVAWHPGYNIELKDDGLLSLTMKATILNGIGDFDKVDVGLMSGFPKIDDINSRDPFTAGLRAIFEATEGGSRLAMVRGMQSYGGAGGAGLGGFPQGDGPLLNRGRGLVPEGITQFVYDPTDNSLIRRQRELGFETLSQNLRAIESENFFVYGVPNLDLKKSDRMFLVIDEGDLAYRLVHKIATRPGTAKPTALRYVTFENGLDVPLTKASAMVTRNGELVGKTNVPYTYMGGEVELSLGEAAYIQSSVSTEVKRTVRGKIKLRDGRVFDETAKTDSITVTNLGSRDAEVVVTHTLVGELHRSSPRALESRTSMTDAVNFDNVLEWSFVLAPGETRVFRAEYSTFARVRKVG